MSVRSVRTSKWLCHLLAALIVCAVGCEISPKPEPPDATLDPNRVDVDAPELGTESPTRGDGVVVSGGPGAASPPGATVRVYNLDSTDTCVESVVGEDGSFEVVVPGAPGDEIRIQVIADGARSELADAEVPLDTEIDGAPGTAGSLSSDCVQIEPPAELVLGSEPGIIEIRNSCTAEVVVEAPTTRVEPSALVVGGGVGWPATVVPGESLSVTVEVVAGAAFEEEIIFLWIGTPPARSAITVHRAD
jgi:hypothetical protein